MSRQTAASLPVSETQCWHARRVAALRFCESLEEGEHGRVDTGLPEHVGQIHRRRCRSVSNGVRRAVRADALPDSLTECLAIEHHIDVILMRSRLSGEFSFVAATQAGLLTHVFPDRVHDAKLLRVLLQHLFDLVAHPALLGRRADRDVDRQTGIMRAGNRRPTLRHRQIAAADVALDTRELLKQKPRNVFRLRAGRDMPAVCQTCRLRHIRTGTRNQGCGRRREINVERSLRQPLHPTWNLQALQPLPLLVHPIEPSGEGFLQLGESVNHLVLERDCRLPSTLDVLVKLVPRLLHKGEKFFPQPIQQCRKPIQNVVDPAGDERQTVNDPQDSPTDNCRSSFHIRPHSSPCPAKGFHERFELLLQAREDVVPPRLNVFEGLLDRRPPLLPLVCQPIDRRPEHLFHLGPQVIPRPLNPCGSNSHPRLDVLGEVLQLHTEAVEERRQIPHERLQN